MPLQHEARGDVLESAQAILFSSAPDPGALQAVFERGLDASPEEASTLTYQTVLRLNKALFPAVTQIELVHTEGCNLACSYCFEKNMLGYKRMPPEIARAAIDLLFDYSGTETSLEVTHFGGEPTLNLPGIRAATEYAEEMADRHGKSLHFNLTSNGVLLTDAMVDYFRQHGIMVLLSIDGLQPSHDRFRVDRRGRGSFERVMRGLQILKRTQPWIGVKMTIMPENASTLFDDTRGLYELGVNEFIIGHATGVPWSAEAMTAFGTELRRLYEWYAQGHPDLRIGEFEAEDQGPHFGCQAGRSSIAITVDGQVSPCSKIMGFDSGRLLSKLGDVRHGLTHLRNRMELVTCGQLKSACEQQGIADDFRGGCFAANYGDAGDLFVPSMQEHAMLLVKRAACAGCGSHKRS